jgi:hypothetical protein
LTKKLLPELTWARVRRSSRQLISTTSVAENCCRLAKLNEQEGQPEKEVGKEFGAGVTSHQPSLHSGVAERDRSEL